jgi:hypothetical protein
VLVTTVLDFSRMSLKHPVARGDKDRRGRFDEFAQRASYFASSPIFFVFCIALVLAWLAGYVVGASASYEQATGSALTATTLILVALLKNAELRGEHAIQSKLDALATGMLESMRDEGDDADAMLQRAIRIDEQI